MEETAMPSSSSVRGSSSGGDVISRNHFSAKQVEALETLYAVCPYPNHLQRMDLICKHPEFANIDSKKIQNWFQNRRSLEKKNRCQRGNNDLKSLYKKSVEENKQLVDEINCLQDQVTELVYDNGCMRLQLRNASSLTTDTGYESTVYSPPCCLTAADNLTSLHLVAKEILRNFLFKATDSTMDWVPIPRKKPDPESFPIISCLRKRVGAAVRACTVVPLDPKEAMKILEYRPSWCQDCRMMEVSAKFPVSDGGIIELIYMQFYAPTTLAPARDFWTLKYTSTLEDGSLVVCEQSISGSNVVPRLLDSSKFVRAKMLTSGQLIRPYERGWSTIHIINHLDLEASTVSEMVRPSNKLSNLVAQKMTLSALHHICQVAKERRGELAVIFGMHPSVLQSLGQRVSRFFNDAINCFNGDGWSLLKYDPADNLILSVNKSKRIGVGSSFSSSSSLFGGVFCVNVSILLQNVCPALLVRSLRECRSEWANFNFDEQVAASSFTFQGLDSAYLHENSVVLEQTNDNKIMEITRLKDHALHKADASLPQDVYILQICEGVQKDALGWSELIFAPIIGNQPNDSLLLSSGFRVLALDTNTDILNTQQAVNLIPNVAVNTAGNHTTGGSLPSSNDSVLVAAFQFPFESHLEDNVVTIAQQYVRNVISCVKMIAVEVTQSGYSPNMGINLIPFPSETVALASRICQSYWQVESKLGLGGDNLLRFDCQTGNAMLKGLWQHQAAILCFLFKPLPACIFSNQAGLQMLETTAVGVQNILLHQIFDNASVEALRCFLEMLKQQEFAVLPAGFCLSLMGHYISYGQAVAWRVHDEEVFMRSLVSTNPNYTELSDNTYHLSSL